ncbi:MAG TPA: peptidylprolyl isomerase [Nocardioides sp.]|nr:peptidylprolyl isomerase [Nocardioides sp.]
MRRAVILAALVTPLLAACGSSSNSSSGASSTAAAGASMTLAPAAGGVSCSWTDTGDASKPVSLPPTTVAKKNYTATIVTSVGTLHIQLSGTTTPCTVASFVSLAMQGYFNNTSCHRLGNTAGFQFLQCGDPTGTGAGGPGYTIPDEITGSETYKAGTLAMANTGQPNTGGSQFFMVYGDSKFPPAYTVFGHLDAASIAVLARVGAAGTGPVDPNAGGGAPKEKVTFESVTIS